MEIIRKTTDHALRVLLHLGDQTGDQDGALVACAQVAKAGDIPGPLAHQVLRRLAIAGFLESSAGRYGGFRLGRPPRDISLLAVVETFQGPFAVRKCATSKRACSRSVDCEVRLRWHQVQGSIIAFLGKTTLHDVFGGRPKTGRRSSKKTGGETGRGARKARGRGY